MEQSGGGVNFAVAGITDWLDGYLARRLGQSTPFGAFLDPVADKLIVVCALALLIEQHSNVWFTIPAMIIIGREIVISALREWMAELGKRASVAAQWSAKLKPPCRLLRLPCCWVVAHVTTAGLKHLAMACCYRRSHDPVVHVYLPAGGAREFRERLIASSLDRHGCSQ